MWPRPGGKNRLSLTRVVGESGLWVSQGIGFDWRRINHSIRVRIADACTEVRTIGRVRLAKSRRLPQSQRILARKRFESGRGRASPADQSLISRASQAGLAAGGQIVRRAVRIVRVAEDLLSV